MKSLYWVIAATIYGLGIVFATIPTILITVAVVGLYKVLEK